MNIMKNIIKRVFFLALLTLLNVNNIVAKPIPQDDSVNDAFLLYEGIYGYYRYGKYNHDTISIYLDKIVVKRTNKEDYKVEYNTATNNGYFIYTYGGPNEVVYRDVFVVSIETFDIYLIHYDHVINTKERFNYTKEKTIWQYKQ